VILLVGGVFGLEHVPTEKWGGLMLALVLSLTRKETGWLWQNPGLAEGLWEIPGIVSARQIEEVADDWTGACERRHQHAAGRAGERRRLAGGRRGRVWEGVVGGPAGTGEPAIHARIHSGREKTYS